MSKYSVGMSDFIDKKSCQNIRLQKEIKEWKPEKTQLKNLQIPLITHAQVQGNSLFTKIRRCRFKDWYLNYTLNHALNTVHQQQWKTYNYLKHNSLPIKAV